MSSLDSAISLLDLQELAREVLPAAAFDYYAGGAADELTLRDNRAAFDRLRLAYKVLAGVGERDLTTRVLGQELSLPVLVAPTAFQKLAHPDGEIATARAAANAGSVMTLSTLSNTPLEEVTAAASGPVWFQLYIYRDREATRALVERAAAAGCSALMLTVDVAVQGHRERDIRNGFHLPSELTIANLHGDGYGALPETEGSGLASYITTMLDSNLTWEDLDWLASISPLPLLIKGVVRADDAVRAVEHGAAGVVVSNHGGRQLDTAVATLDSLPAIAEALSARDDRATLLLDGGVRRGTDVLKALALGAHAVLLGRSVLWGLALDGQTGVERVFTMLRDEFDRAMGLAGARTVGEVTPDLVLPPTG